MLIINHQWRMRWLNLLLRFRSFNFWGVSIARGSIFNAFTVIDKGTRINGPCIVKGEGSLKIGRFCAIGDAVRFITTNHSINTLSLQYRLQEKVGISFKVAEKQNIAIGHDVWIGDCCILLPGISVGDGAVIGAGSVVTTSIPPYTVAAGNPAKIIKPRASKEVAGFLQELGWWNWPEKYMKNHPIFTLQLSTVNVDEIKMMLEKSK